MFIFRPVPYVRFPVPFYARYPVPVPVPDVLCPCRVSCHSFTVSVVIHQQTTQRATHAHQGEISLLTHFMLSSSQILYFGGGESQNLRFFFRL